MSKRLGRWSGIVLPALFALLLAGGLTTPSFADVTDFTWTPTPIRVGQNATYTAVDDGTKPILSCKWQYQYVNGLICTSGWYTGNSTNTTQSWFESTPGTYNVWLTVTYSPVGFPPVALPSTEIVKTVTVLEANGFVVTKGYNTSTANGTRCPHPRSLR